MRFIKKLLLLMLLIIVATASFYTYKGYNMYKRAINDMDLKTKVETIRNNRDYVKICDVPKYYLDAVVDIEDHRFYSHPGIDFASIIRALINNIRAKEIMEGGSSITQQLAKNMYFTQKQEIARKIAEIFVVYNLENNYDKDDILEMYVNISYFGDGYYGIRQASNGYLGKEPRDMTLLDATLLAGIPNAPSVYAPTKNPDLATQRQKSVIQSMVKYGDLSEKDAKDLLKKLE